MRRFMIPLSFLVAVSILHASCSTGRWVRTEVASTDDFEVFLEQRLTEDGIVPMGNNHPCSVDGGDLATILSGLYYKDETFLGKEERSPVFLHAEARALAPALSHALATAIPDQRVSFNIQVARKGLILPSRRMTKGVLFAGRDGKLNILFSRINMKDLSVDLVKKEEDNFPREPTRITSSETPLIAQTWMTIHRRADTGKFYPLWGEIDTAAALASLEKLEEKAPASTEASAAAPDDEMSEDKTAVPPPVDKERLKARLKILSELFEEGLITEEEYSKKKAELLESL